MITNDANNASAINLLHDESIFNDAEEVLLYSQPKTRGKLGDNERVFKEYHNESSEAGNVLVGFQKGD